MSDYYGDIRLGDTIDVKFTTRQASGAPFTLAGSPVISAYPANSTTQVTAGITLSVDFDGVTGYNNVRIVATSGNGYATATNYDLCITTGTVNSVSVVGESIGSFSVENRSALMPTTSTRTLDVSATGEAGVDWANVGSPTTSLALTGTTIAPTQKVDLETIKTQAVTCAGGVTVPAATLASTINITAGTMTTTTNLTNAPTAGDLTATMKTSVQTAADAAVTANTLVNAIAGYIDTEIAAIYAALTGNRAEPGQGVPAASTSLLAKIDYLYKWTRNRSTQTATEASMYADNASTVDQKRSVSDDGSTFDRGEIGSGP